MSAPFYIIIPARYNSSRLPGKVLLDIGGKSMLQRVYERANQTSAAEVFIATDDERIAEASKKFKAPVLMTSSDHSTGTDRLAEAAALLGLHPEEIVVNVQADEPMIPLSSIEEVAESLAKNKESAMSTLCTFLRDETDLRNPNVVKVVRNHANEALYFSRASIPWLRDTFQEGSAVTHTELELFRWHVGIYAYRVKFLQRYVNWLPSPLESAEKLEQLRALWYGEKIYVADAKEPSSFDVNTEEDLQRIRAWFADQKESYEQ